MAEALRGELEHVSLGSVLQLAETERLCGELMLDRGSLELHHGVVVGGSYLGQSGADAVIEALLRACGDFAFAPREASPTNAKAVGTTMNLVLESCRLWDEAERLAPLALEPGPGFEASNSTLRLLVTRLDGKRPLARAIVQSGVPLTAVLDPVLEAVEDGRLLTRGRVNGEVSIADLFREVESADDPTDEDELASDDDEDEPSVQPATDTRSFDDLIFEARKLTRARSYDDAAALLEVALTLRPGHRIAIQNLNRIKSLMQQSR